MPSSKFWIKFFRGENVSESLKFRSGAIALSPLYDSQFSALAVMIFNELWWMLASKPTSTWYNLLDSLPASSIQKGWGWGWKLHFSVGELQIFNKGDNCTKNFNFAPHSFLKMQDFLPKILYFRWKFSDSQNFFASSAHCHDATMMIFTKLWWMTFYCWIESSE